LKGYCLSIWFVHVCLCFVSLKCLSIYHVCIYTTYTILTIVYSVWVNSTRDAVQWWAVRICTAQVEWRTVCLSTRNMAKILSWGTVSSSMSLLYIYMYPSYTLWRYMYFMICEMNMNSSWWTYSCNMRV
jgi:hypothetical protein